MKMKDKHQKVAIILSYEEAELLLCALLGDRTKAVRAVKVELADKLDEYVNT